MEREHGLVRDHFGLDPEKLCAPSAIATGSYLVQSELVF